MHKMRTFLTNRSRLRHTGRLLCIFFFSSRRRHTRLQGDWSSDVCSSDLAGLSLGKRSSAGEFLIRYCGSFKELRNHQTSAKARLEELDESFGSLAKKQIGRASCRERV